MIKKFFRRKRIVLPAEYGTIERRERIGDDDYEVTTELVLLRQPVDMPADIYKHLEYETVSERVLIEPSREFTRDGERYLVPAKYKTITKQQIKRVNKLPPTAAVKLIKFFSRRDVREKIINELEADYQEEQLLEFGTKLANIWYWKEVLALLVKGLIRSPFVEAAKEIKGFNE